MRHFLSSTCKRMAEICATILFHSVRLDELDSEHHRQLVDTTGKVGPLIQNLTLILFEYTDDEEEQPIHQILSELPNVRSLTVIHQREDVADHTILHQVVDKFSRLEEVTLYEEDYEPQWALPYCSVELAGTFFHRFLHTILKAHGNHLRGLHIYTLLLLDQTFYRTIRDNTPNLRAITFTANIDDSLHGLFTDSTPWISGRTGSFDRIRLQSCRGVHMGHFARDVMNGVYGTSLKEVSTIACGLPGNEDVPYIPPVGTPARASINHLQIDHFVLWELCAMSSIPVRELSLTQIHLEAFVELPILLEKRSSGPNGTHLAFPGLGHLRLSPTLASQGKLDKLEDKLRYAFQELKGVCLRRGVHLSLDADEHLMSDGSAFVG